VKKLLTILLSALIVASCTAMVHIPTSKPTETTRKCLALLIKDIEVELANEQKMYITPEQFEQLRLASTTIKDMIEDIPGVKDLSLPDVDKLSFEIIMNLLAQPQQQHKAILDNLNDEQLYTLIFAINNLAMENLLELSTAAFAQRAISPEHLNRLITEKSADNYYEQYDFPGELSVTIGNHIKQQQNLEHRLTRIHIQQQTEQLIHTLTDPAIPDGTSHTSWIWSVAISSDNRHIVTGSKDKTAKIWDAQTRQLLHTLTDHTGWIYSIAISSDNRFIITGSDDTTAKVWNAQTGQLIHSLIGHTGPIWSVAISPDNNFIVTGSWDRTAKIWNAQTGQLLHTLTPASWIYSVAISSDNSFIVTGSWDNTAKIWQFIDPAFKTALKNLTLQQVQLIIMRLQGIELPAYAHNVLPPVIQKTLQYKPGYLERLKQWWRER